MRRGAPLAAAAVLLAGAAAAPVQAAPPQTQGAAAIVVDARDGAVIYQKRPDDRRAIASTTKLMTAMLALERARPGQVYTAPAYNALPVESKINLRQGERMRVSDLLEALLLESANDAAVTIAEGVAGSRAAFVEEMNARAGELALADSSFANPIGLDDSENYSSARDLAKLSVQLMRNRRFARIVDQPKAVLESGSRRRVVANRNKLVARFPFVDGIKTGHTLNADYVLVGAAAGRGGARVVSVVLGEPSEAARDSDTVSLLRFGLSQFRRSRVLVRGRPVARLDVEHRDPPAPVAADRSVTATVRKGQRLERRIDVPDQIEGPIEKGERLGSVTVLRGRERIARANLVAAEEVPGPGIVRRVGGPFTLVLALAILAGAAIATMRLRAKSRTGAG